MFLQCDSFISVIFIGPATSRAGLCMLVSCKITLPYINVLGFMVLLVNIECSGPYAHGVFTAQFLVPRIPFDGYNKCYSVTQLSSYFT